MPSYFNSHAHVERDHYAPNSADSRNHFNSHAHVERDELTDDDISDEFDFNSHAHVERDEVEAGGSVTFKFQLTRSRGA